VNLGGLLLVLAGCTVPVDESDDTDVVDESDDTDLVDESDDTDGADDTDTPACAAPAPADPADARLSYATVRGEGLDGGVRRWLGVRYAAPPLGDLRFRAPASPACVTEVVPATAPGSLCPQWVAGEVVGDEDCLFLNVWSPPDADGAPVLVWWHGGGHEQGGSTETLPWGGLKYDGGGLAARGVVVVTVNYRLGPFGFLAHEALDAGADGNGNWGTLDQLASLAWVRDHIEAFGGDPGRVTVAGQSAGGVSVCRGVTSPRAAGLVHRAATLSGGCVATPLDEALAQGDAVGADVGCAGDAAACLRGASVADLMATFEPLTDGVSTLGGSWSGVIDGVVVPEAPRDAVAAGRVAVDAALVSTTEEEAGRTPVQVADEAAFRQAVRGFTGRPLPDRLLDTVVDLYAPTGDDTWTDAFIQVAGDLKFVCVATKDLGAWAEGGTRVRRQLFDDAWDELPAGGSNRPFHGADLLHLFGGLEGLEVGPSAADLALADDMVDSFAAFVATGDPRPDGRDWPTWSPGVDAAWRFASAGAGRIDGVHAERCAFWASVAP
jgi:para-nitrobenzyl esterase